MTVRWTHRAVADLEEIGRYIAEDNPEAANRWIGTLRARAVAADRTPLAGRLVPEWSETQVREVIERSYRIIYRVEPDGILVLTVHHARRLLRAP